MTTRRTAVGLALVGVGYAAAAAAAFLAVWWKNRGVSQADMLASSGMFAFADAHTFLAVASIAGIVPTVMLVRIVRTSPLFWNVHAGASLLLASTALAAGVVLHVLGGRSGELARGLHALSVVRVLSAPLFLLVYAPGFLQEPGPPRKMVSAACVVEVAAMASFVAWIATKVS